MMKAELFVPKKLKRDGGVFLPRTIGAMRDVAAYLTAAISSRVKSTRTDGTGASLGKLSGDGSGWFYTSVNDNRFKGLKRVKAPADIKGDAKRARHGQAGKGVMLVDFDGYGAVKRKMGAKNRKDGTLTGDMWRGLSATLKRHKDGWGIRLHFKGGTRSGKVAGYGNKTVRRVEDGKVVIKKIRVPKMKTQTVRNRDKARKLQYQGSRAVFALLSMTAEEKQVVRDMWLEKVKIFK